MVYFLQKIHIIFRSENYEDQIYIQPQYRHIFLQNLYLIFRGALQKRWKNTLVEGGGWMQVLFSGTKEERERQRGRQWEECSSALSDSGLQWDRAWVGLEGRQQSRWAIKTMNRPVTKSRKREVSASWKKEADSSTGSSSRGSWSRGQTLRIHNRGQGLRNLSQSV